MKKLLPLLPLLLISLSLSAQLSHGGKPLLMGSKAPVQTVTLPMIDNQALLQEDMDGLPGSGPMRMGVMQPADIHLSATEGVERLAVASPGAYSIELYFSEYELSKEAKLFIYNDRGFCLGAFTSENRQQDGTFWTQAIPGESCILELQGPGRLTINRVCHNYKPFNAYHDGKDRMGIAGPCHINVVCPTGDPYRDEIRSVVHLKMATPKASYVCSGALINNTANDKTPYILTAYHCQDLNGAIQWSAYFNYEATFCDNDWVGPSDQSLIGADIVAKETPAGGSDMCLLRLHDAVPDSYHAYYAGWDRNVVERPTDNRKICFGIHHPAGDFKKISIPFTVRQGQGTGIIWKDRENNEYYTVNFVKYYKVEWNDQGIIEGGSSGSPLFNSDKLIIGQLSAGHGDCSDPGNAEGWYGRFASDWVGAGNPSTRVSDWLDPLGTGTKQCPGLNWDTTVTPGMPLAEELHVYPNPSYSGMVRFDLDSIGEAVYTVYNAAGGLVYEGTTILATTTQALNLSFLPDGAYVLHLVMDNKRYIATIIIRK